MKILVTGASGFVGSSLLAGYQASSIETVAIYRTKPDRNLGF